MIATFSFICSAVNRPLIDVKHRCRLSKPSGKHSCPHTHTHTHTHTYTRTHTHTHTHTHTYTHTHTRTHTQIATPIGTSVRAGDDGLKPPQLSWTTVHDSTCSPETRFDTPTRSSRLHCCCAKCPTLDTDGPPAEMNRQNMVIAPSSLVRHEQADSKGP